MRLTRRFNAALLLLLATASHADDSYIVAYVYDGDTVKLRNADGELKLRLTDIDAPERNQAYGLKARRALIKLCQGPNIAVTLLITGTDKYNRALGKLECNHVDVSTYLISLGLAWHYTQYSSNQLLHNAELKARQQKIGLWANENPTPPWVWRHQQMH